ncbi:MAG: AcrB/AcrD/AcrF family protein [Calditrichaeota bacterium]|nr:MAG: AcrB/AcrD/AcrF family protein [Calditrichota bacterium]
MLDKLIRFCLENKLVVILLLLFTIAWGLIVAPFDYDLGILPRNPVRVDAIPDIGENQQIIFTEWKGKSPQDVEDQISYPLTTALLGIPGVKSIRSFSMFGFSSIYLIFKEDVEFYWSRSRVLEKLNSLPKGTLPENVSPTLGPDATPLGQVFWYTLEGQDENGNVTGGWDLHELRSIQDYYVRYALSSAEGVAEVASVGGFVKEYQIDVDPDAMRNFNVNLNEVYTAIRNSNVDVGAKTIEINQVEYVIRGVGYIKSLEDLEKTVIKSNENVPILIKDIATVNLGPALRRGILDKEGAEAVGGVVVTRYGGNPLEVIKNVKQKISEIETGLPQKTLSDGTVSKVKIVPFYDRTGLINETLGTLNSALTEEILVTIIVILVMVGHFYSSILISLLLPIAVLMCFIGMKLFDIEANIVALSGIAIAIGTMVDMGIVVTENILRHLEKSEENDNKLEVIFKATSEVGSAILTAIATTVISFLPIFTMEAAEGKLFRPLAYTKTFALIASVIVALTMIPPFAQLLFTGKIKSDSLKKSLNGILVLLGIYSLVTLSILLGLILITFGLYKIFESKLPKVVAEHSSLAVNIFAISLVVYFLTKHWLPLGVEAGILLNLLFVGILIFGVLFLFKYFIRIYPNLLFWTLENKSKFLILVSGIVLSGFMVWLGVEKTVGKIIPNFAKENKIYSTIIHEFPGLGKEFMPSLDEGSYLFMPTTMPHASIGEALDVIQKLDKQIKSVPEVELVVGKLGRADSPLDPAPISMVETIVNYKPEYNVDKNGNKINYKFENGEYERDSEENLIENEDGLPFRNWRPEIKSPDDIWKEIVKVAKIPGTTSAPKLQPIAARIVMLQSGMRAPIGIKVKGPNLETIERFGLELEKLLKEVPSVEPASVFADRIVGKPYLEIRIDRDEIARYGISIRQVQNVIEVAIGGKTITTSVEGRERYPIRVRYQRELRDDIESLGKILVPTPEGVQIPLIQLASVEYVRGPQVIKSEDTFLVGYVLLDKKDGFAEVEVVEEADEFLKGKIRSGELIVPDGVSYKFAGNYENQIRSEKKLAVVLPLALFIIFLILYFQFKSVSTTALVFSGILVAWSGGFLMIWLYDQSWFLNFSLLGFNLREVFNIFPVNLSVAVWVGFIALFGIATDDGVVMATYLEQSFKDKANLTKQQIRDLVLEAGKRRIRPCLMTTATTLLALIPILTSTGRGSDIMVPMAIPSFGGMVIALVTLFVVPVLYSWIKEIRLTS